MAKKKSEVIDGSKKPKPRPVPPAPVKPAENIPLKVGKNVGRKDRIGTGTMEIKLNEYYAISFVIEENLVRQGMAAAEKRGAAVTEVMIQIDDNLCTYTLDEFKERLGF